MPGKSSTTKLLKSGSTVGLKLIIRPLTPLDHYKLANYIFHKIVIYMESSMNYNIARFVCVINGSLELKQ